MNYKEEPYPENLSSLLNYAEQLSNEIVIKLNSTSCEKIKELHYFKKGRIKRNEAIFIALGYSPNTYLKTKSKKIINNEFKGLYVFGEEIDGKVIPVYIGISRTVFRRLRQHGFGKKHNECSLAYLMTREQYKRDNKAYNRAIITNTDLEPSKKIIQSLKVVLIPVEDDYNLYFYEVAIAGILKTKWNSFRTH
jgi:hypothetical protein